MATAQNPGIGRGKGGGRPKRGESVKVGGIDLSPRAAELLQAHLDATGLPLWKVFDDLVKTGLGGEAPPEIAPKLPPFVLDLAKDAAVFLACHEDTRAASRALRKAWERAILLAAHDLKGSSVKKHPEE